MQGGHEFCPAGGSRVLSWDHQGRLFDMFINANANNSHRSIAGLVRIRLRLRVRVRVRGRVRDGYFTLHFL